MSDKSMPLDAGFAKLLAQSSFEGKPSSEVNALGMLMSHWLKTEMADADTHVDTGAGIDKYDLWVKFGGVEMLVTIQKSGAQLAKEAVK